MLRLYVWVQEALLTRIIHNIDKNYDLLILKIRKVLKGIYVSGKIKKVTGCVTGKI